jgi:hypothetical protein
VNDLGLAQLSEIFAHSNAFKCKLAGTTARSCCAAAAWSGRRKPEDQQNQRAEADVRVREYPPRGIIEDQPMCPVADEIARVARLPRPPAKPALERRKGAHEAEQIVDANQPHRYEMDRAKAKVPDPIPFERNAYQDRREPENHEAHKGRVRDYHNVGKNSSGHCDLPVFRGKVVSGLGEGPYFIRLDWVCQQFLIKFGCEPVPGTFTVRVRREGDALLETLKDLGGIAILPANVRWHRGFEFVSP